MWPSVTEMIPSFFHEFSKRLTFSRVDPIMSANLITRTSDSVFDSVTLFETRIKPLRNAVRPCSFRF